jgi:two-component system phosphate regulon response regulator OmpR
MTAMDALEPAHVLVVDDDRRLRELLQRYLSDNGFRVTTAADAEAARAKLDCFAFDLLVLDVMMPGEDGLALTAWLRRTSQVPILLLTARGEPDDRIAGLEHGADDYLAKPFEPRELLLRINSILRRSTAQAAVQPAPTDVRFGDFRFDLRRLELANGDSPVRLTSAEAGLLRALAGPPGVVKSRDELSRECAVAGGVRTIDVQVTRLRRKIEPDPKFPRYLQTVRGRGYVLRAD